MRSRCSDWEGGCCKANQPLDVLECTQEANSAHENVGNKVMCLGSLGLANISRNFGMCCNESNRANMRLDPRDEACVLTEVLESECVQLLCSSGMYITPM